MKRAIRALGTAALLAASATGCDWIHYAFMNSIPFHGDPKKNPDVYVYLGVDGLSYHTVQQAMKDGTLADPSWRLAKEMTPYPGTSDYSWSRIMHSEKIGGYEMEYYDPTQDKVINKGLLGVARHIMPTLAETFSFEAAYLGAFDYRANGYTHSLNAYSDTFVSLADSMDNLFFLLEGRAETDTVMSAYLLEFDVLGHMKSSPDVSRAFKSLTDRIAQFQRKHPERNFHFTLFSDHGMDFIPVASDKLISFDKDTLKSVGITLVDSLKDQDPNKDIYALPIMHTRVTYIAVHTHPDLVEEVGTRLTKLESVDLATSRLKAPPKDAGTPNLEWFAVWSDGGLAAYFGYDSAKNEYYLPADNTFERFGFKIPSDAPAAANSSAYKVMSDQALFDLTKFAKYPDMFYRIRTGHSPVGGKYPAELLVSFKANYASLGFRLPGGVETTSAGYHGSLEELGSAGTCLTQERDLPDAVRSDNILELFPRLKEHVAKLGLQYVDGDAHAKLQGN